MTVTIVPVKPDRLDLAWPTVEPWLVNAMKHGPRLYLPEDVLEACRKKEFILWVAIANEQIIGMAVTSVEQYPQMLVASIKWGGGIQGRGKEWLLPMIETLKGWGRNFEAGMLAGMGRKGWLGKWSGFKDGGVIFQMDLRQ